LSDGPSRASGTEVTRDVFNRGETDRYLSTPFPESFRDRHLGGKFYILKNKKNVFQLSEVIYKSSLLEVRKYYFRKPSGSAGVRGR